MYEDVEADHDSESSQSIFPIVLIRVNVEVGKLCWGGETNTKCRSSPKLIQVNQKTW